MTLEIINHPFAYEMECIARLFYPGEKITVVKSAESGGGSEIIVTSLESLTDSRTRLYVRVCLNGFDKCESDTRSAGEPDAQHERGLAVLLFRLLCEKTGTRPPWGILTGVRPVRLCHNMARQGKSESEILDMFTHEYLTSPEKARLALNTARAEAPILALDTPDNFSLYIGIPFCPTRCLYCSFVSHAIDKAMKLIPDYVRLLREEIRAAGNLARECGLKLCTIYIGGGTPTSLEAAQLAGIMGAVNESFDLSSLREYTVEAGRPDTITTEKLAVLREYGADRISINPQTMNDAVLDAIGRRHTSKQTLDAFSLARQAGFRVINADLIAGLPGETSESFLDGLSRILKLEPENITVHTLTVKRSSGLRAEADAFAGTGYDLSALLDSGRTSLEDCGYFPYYLYRQKGTKANLENVGYSVKGRECLYNVYVMEETHSILAVGAGAVTKLCAPQDKIRRIFNFKYPYEYISRFDEVLSRKTAVRSFYESNT